MGILEYLLRCTLLETADQIHEAIKDIKGGNETRALDRLVEVKEILEQAVKEIR